MADRSRSPRGILSGGFPLIQLWQIIKVMAADADDENAEHENHDEEGEHEGGSVRSSSLQRRQNTSSIDYLRTTRSSRVALHMKTLLIKTAV